AAITSIQLDHASAQRLPAVRSPLLSVIDTALISAPPCGWIETDCRLPRVPIDRPAGKVSLRALTRTLSPLTRPDTEPETPRLDSLQEPEIALPRACTSPPRSKLVLSLAQRILSRSALPPPPTL